ncbi:MAG: hypothetical protein KJ995_08085 [Candidatus Omnitrophica bacterium]|nr:hypothetical protein [Candidatus Omnitrophota bacterium]
MGTDGVKPRKAQKVSDIPQINISGIKASLRTRIKFYKKRAKEIEGYLSKHPDEWGKFQSEFNAEINGIFYDIMIFEKINLSKGYDHKVEKLKSLFEKHLRNIFLRGVYGASPQSLTSFN